MMMLSSEAGMRFGGIVDMAAHYEASRGRNGQGVNTGNGMGPMGKDKARRKF